MHKIQRLYFIIFFQVAVCFYAGAQMNPNYMAHVGRKWSGPVKRGEFLAQMGVGAYQKITTSHWEPVSVQSFTLMVLRDTTVLFTFRNTGNLFSADLQTQLKKVSIGDKILVFDIVALVLAGEEKVFLQPLEYLIE